MWVAQAVGEQHDALAIVHVLGEHAELVAAQPREHFAGAHLLAHHHRQLRQQLVARDVARRVVDHLELVEVDVQQGTWRPACGQPRQRLLDLAFEFAAIEQLGQRVMAGLVGQQFGQLSLLGDVRRDHQQFRCAVQAHFGNRQSRPERDRHWCCARAASALLQTRELPAWKRVRTAGSSNTSTSSTLSTPAPRRSRAAWLA